jgi:hypothetical protein
MVRRSLVVVVGVGFALLGDACTTGAKNLYGTSTATSVTLPDRAPLGRDRLGRVRRCRSQRA